MRVVGGWYGGPVKPMTVLLLALAVFALSPASGASQTLDGGSPLFASVTTERRDRFHHEVFEFTVSVYSRGLTLGREIALANEETPGLQFRPYQDLGTRHEEIEGKVYDVRRFLGRAEAGTVGTQTLRLSVHLSIVVPARGRGGSRRDSDAARAEIREAELHPPPLAVRVRSLPEAGKPPAFAGAVGSFTFTASVRPQSVAAGEPVILTMEVRGNGNIGSLGAPHVAADEQFRLYEPKLLRREVSDDGSGGRLVFEQTIVPRSVSSTSAPAATFVYFDPDLQSYREIVRGPFALGVRPGVQSPRPVADLPAGTPAVAKPRLPAVIAPLKAEPRVWAASAGGSRLASPWFVALQLVPLAFVVVLFLAQRRREELARDVPKARRHLAPVAGRAGIAAAGEALRQGDAVRFHDALWDALSSYYGHRLNLRPGEISGAAVAASIGGAGLEPRDAARVGEIFDHLEQERFGRPSVVTGPVGAAQQRRFAELLGEVERLIQASEAKEP